MPTASSESKRGSQTGHTATDDHDIGIARASNRHDNLQQQTTKYIEQQMEQGGEDLPVAQWVSKARKRGYLTDPPIARRPGGHLTDKAKDLIAEHGLTSPRPETNDRSE